jgi:aconitase B
MSMLLGVERACGNVNPVPWPAAARATFIGDVQPELALRDVETDIIIVVIRFGLAR